MTWSNFRNINWFNRNWQWQQHVTCHWWLTLSLKWSLFFLWTSFVKCSVAGFGSLFSSSRMSNIPDPFPSIRSVDIKSTNQSNSRGVATGEHTGIYTLPKIRTNKLFMEQLWHQNDYWPYSTMSIKVLYLPPQKLSYLPKTNFWLSPSYSLSSQHSKGHCSVQQHVNNTGKKKHTTNISKQLFHCSSYIIKVQ